MSDGWASQGLPIGSAPRGGGDGGRAGDAEHEGGDGVGGVVAGEGAEGTGDDDEEDDVRIGGAEGEPHRDAGVETELAGGAVDPFGLDASCRGWQAIQDVVAVGVVGELAGVVVVEVGGLFPGAADGD